MSNIYGFLQLQITSWRHLKKIETETELSIERTWLVKVEVEMATSKTGMLKSS